MAPGGNSNSLITGSYFKKIGPDYVEMCIKAGKHSRHNNKAL